MNLIRKFFNFILSFGLVALFLSSNLVLFLSAREPKKVQECSTEPSLQIEEYVLVDLREENEEVNDERAEVENEIEIEKEEEEEEEEEEKEEEKEEEETTSTSQDDDYFVLYAKCTAYCSCEKCCGDYATSRPLDENGEPIVYTASGRRAVPEYSIAMSSSYAFGTMVEIPGIGMCEVMDRGGAVNGAVIDIYFGSHEDALNWGCKWLEVKVYG